MIRYFLVVAAALLPLCSVGQTKPKTAPKPATSSTEQFESQLAVEVCQDFEKQNAARPFDKLSQADAMSLMKQSMMQVAMKHPQEIEQIMAASGGDASAAMQAMGQRVATKLAGDCPVALKLFARMAGTEAPSTTPDMTVTDAERPLLEKLASAVCTDLSTQDAKQPLAKMPTAERMVLVQQMMTKQMKANEAALIKQYGASFFQDSGRITSMGMKVGSLMAGKCPTQVATFTQP